MLNVSSVDVSQITHATPSSPHHGSVSNHTCFNSLYTGGHINGNTLCGSVSIYGPNKLHQCQTTISPSRTWPNKNKSHVISIKNIISPLWTCPKSHSLKKNPLYNVGYINRLRCISLLWTCPKWSNLS